jgi:hypothetical protein
MMALTREPSSSARPPSGWIRPTAADRADDALDDPHQVPVVFETRVHGFEHAVLLDEDPIEAVHRMSEISGSARSA